MSSTLKGVRMSQVSQEALRIEAELARRDLEQFCITISEGRWQTAPHLKLICSLLMEAEAHVAAQHDEPYLLMISMGPRHGKSELISRLFPPWFLGRNQDLEAIIASYGADLALDMSRDARTNYLRAAEFYGWPDISRDSSAVARWHLQGKGGKLQAAGVGGPLTGRGGSMILIDDPVKNIDDGESLIVQRRVWDWYRSTVRTRLAPGGAIVLLMTRWHSGDLAGRLIREMDKGGEQWKVVSLPALALDGDPLGRKKGEALWPWRFNEKALAAVKRGLGGRLWGALYQQDPTADIEGALWDAETMIDPFREAVIIEELEEINVAVDPAGSGQVSSDLTGITVQGRRTDGHGVVLNDSSDHYEPDEWGTRALELCLEFNTRRIVAEKNFGYMLVKRNIQVSSAEWEGQKLDGEDVEVELVHASRGKFQRADPVANKYKQGLVHHDLHADLDDLEDEQCQWIGRGPRRSKWSPNRIDSVTWGLTDLLIDNAGGGVDWIDLGE